MLVRAFVFSFAFWMLSCTIAVAQSQSVHREHLKWMVPQMGQWRGTATMGDSTMKLHGEVRWMLRRNFVKSHFVGDDGEESLEIIGWDPTNERVQRWTFMSNGTHATSYLKSRSETQRVWDAAMVSVDGQSHSYQMTVEPTVEKDLWKQQTKNSDGDVVFTMDLKRADTPDEDSSDSDSDSETKAEEDLAVDANLQFLNTKTGTWRGDFEYTHAGQKSTLKAVSRISWVLGNHFQLTETRFLQDGTNTGAVWVITGWDASVGKARSWMATSWGTYTESTLTDLQGNRQEWESVDTSVTGDRSNHHDIVKLSADGTERTVVRKSADGSEPFKLKLTKRE